jgi:diguanylate cyclase (GGDEF)-like protein
VSPPDTSRPSCSSAAAALQAVARLLSTATHDGRGLQLALVRGARELLGGGAVALIEVDERERTARAVEGDIAASEAFGFDDAPALAEALDRRHPASVVSAERAPRLAGLLEANSDSLLIVPLRCEDQPAEEVLLLTAPTFEAEVVELAGAFGEAAAAALGHGRSSDQHARELARQAALTRAAKTLHEPSDLETLLTRICREACAILEADTAVVYRGTPEDSLTVAAAAGAPPEIVGTRLEPGAGLSGKVLQTGVPMLTNDYRSIPGVPSGAAFGRYEAALAMPFMFSDDLRGVLAVGYAHAHRVAQDDLKLLETFAELAAVACRNAALHAGLAQAARTDGLTGCLNHAALHESLAREIQRVARDPERPLSLILFDLDDFKRVNEEQGHLVGDEVLRRVGHALRGGTRPYDIAARYGGDEFALLAVEADEEQAADIARRTIARVSAAAAEFGESGPGGATAGVAEWMPGLSPTQLIARADRALLHGKQVGARGEANLFSTLPEPETVRRFERRFAEPPAVPGPAMPPAWPEARDEAGERLRKRTRQLATANALGARLSAMTDADEILDAVVDELHRAFGYYCCAVVRIREDGHVESAAGRGDAFLALGDRSWSQPREVGLIGRCLRERRPVLVGDVYADPDYTPTPETLAVRSELIVPLLVAGELWGVINVEELELDAFDEDDLRLMETMADQVGSALRSASLYERLERAYMGTAEALAAALEAKDSYTAHHGRSIVERAEAVGRRLGLDADALRDLRFGAVFHDIGKIAVPEAILNKRGPLTAEERSEIERHTIVGEQILAPVEFLAGARRLVRHEHERWDGAGYPDGLAGEEIPLGARIILACDALHAMTSDRPYRRAMPEEQAWAELRANAGTQFDPRVVVALLAEVGASGVGGARAGAAGPGGAGPGGAVGRRGAGRPGAVAPRGGRRHP